MLKKDYGTEVKFYSGNVYGEQCYNYDDYVSRIRSGNYKKKYESTVKRSLDGVLIKTVQWESITEDDEFMCSRASYIGGFILSYAHTRVDDTIEEILGSSRRDGTMTAQIVNGDTDSLMVNIKHLRGKNIEYHLTKLGAFNDDLKKKYAKSDAPIEYHGGLPNFGKIISMESPAKKMYCMEIITPTGGYLKVNPKSKGISKGSDKVIRTGLKRKQVMEEASHGLYPEVADESDRAKKKRLCEKKEYESEAFQQYISDQPMIDEFTNDVLYNACNDPESEGIVVMSSRMKKSGFKVSSKDISLGIEPYSIRNIEVVQHILKKGAQLPPERMSVPSLCYCPGSDEKKSICKCPVYDNISVPQGYRARGYLPMPQSYYVPSN